ncbi:uncharacterized protein LOC127806073 isoform X2 [Diospyros lotus]|uniref:uncharacterized protein LOC127806073 isoform X2 n=1 Tax=Diospyros lotus TaxID=55363 RepID=UPI00224C97D7|nr:uncharacterized protein LOC127806073 isoform X2 [Diospyros lotus]
MAVVVKSTAPSPPPPSFPSSSPSFQFHRISVDVPRRLGHGLCPPIAVACPSPPPRTLDKSALKVAEAAAASEDQLWAAACLRIRSFYDFQPTLGIEDHKRYLAEREFEALKERVAGKRTGFKRVSCISATLPLSHVANVFDDLCSACKGIGADFARAYLSNVCVAKELQRNGLGCMLIAKSKEIAEDWGISDLYVHVAVDNEPAKKLYMKSGFIYESEEPAWQARFLDRPRRILLWTEIPNTLDL